MSPEGFEPSICCSGGNRSIQLSHGDSLFLVYTDPDITSGEVRRVEDSNPCGFFNPPRFERGALPLCQPSLRFAQGKPFTPQGKPFTPQGKPFTPQGKPFTPQGKLNIVFTLRSKRRPKCALGETRTRNLMVRNHVLYPIKLRELLASLGVNSLH